MKAIVKGKKIEVRLITLLARKDQVFAHIVDKRNLSTIAKAWEGADVIEKVSENEGNATYKGYTRLMRIMRRDDVEADCVEIVLGKN